MGCTQHKGGSSPELTAAVLREILVQYSTKRIRNKLKGDAKERWKLLQQLLSAGKMPAEFSKLNKNQLSVFFDRYWQYVFTVAIIYKEKIVQIRIIHPEGVPHITSKQWCSKYLDSVVEYTLESMKKRNPEQLKQLNWIASERQRVKLLDPKL